jgi:hypothetical protein
MTSTLNPSLENMITTLINSFNISLFQIRVVFYKENNQITFKNKSSKLLPSIQKPTCQILIEVITPVSEKKSENYQITFMNSP